MEQEIMKKEPELAEEIIKKIVTTGDISGLNDIQKLAYLKYTCQRLELDPAAQPFNLIKFQQGSKIKEVLYCTKAGAEQLTKNNNVSHEIMSEKSENGLYIVKARASLSNGRFVEDVGIVDISKGFSGTPPNNAELANLMLKAVTKAKRRATLSLLGLGMMDETEAETLPKINEPPQDTGGNGKEKPAPTGSPFSKQVLAKCARCGNDITSPNVLNKSMERFDKPLCFPLCQNNEERERKEKTIDAEYIEEIPDN